MFFYEFSDRRKVVPKTQRSITLADKVKRCTSFGRGRKERRGARERGGIIENCCLNLKECSTVVFVFGFGTPLRRGAADLKATAFGVDP